MGTHNRDRLERWKKRKLEKYDTRERFRKVRNEKYGGRGGYAKFLDHEIEISIKEASPFLKPDPSKGDSAQAALEARSGDDTLIAKLKNCELVLTDAKNGGILYSATLSAGVSDAEDIYFEKDKYHLIIRCNSSQVYSFDLMTKNLLKCDPKECKTGDLTGAKGTVMALRAQSNDGTLAAILDDRSLTLADTRTGATVYSTELSEDVADAEEMYFETDEFHLKIRTAKTHLFTLDLMTKHLRKESMEQINRSSYEPELNRAAAFNDMNFWRTTIKCEDLPDL